MDEMPSSHEDYGDAQATLKPFISIHVVWLCQLSRKLLPHLCCLAQDKGGILFRMLLFTILFSEVNWSTL